MSDNKNADQNTPENIDFPEDNEININSIDNQDLVPEEELPATEFPLFERIDSTLSTKIQQYIGSLDNTPEDVLAEVNLNTVLNRTVNWLIENTDIKTLSAQNIEALLLSMSNATIRKINTVRTDGGRNREFALTLPYQRTLSFYQIACVMLAKHHICRIGPSDKNTDRDQDLLAFYDENPKSPNFGIYITGEDAFRAIARAYDVSMKENDFQEVLSVLREKATRLVRNMDRDLVPVNNGVFNYRTKQLLDFSPEYIFVSKSQVDFDPNAKNPEITMPDGEIWDVDTWMNSLSDDPEITQVLWEITGALIRPYVRWNKSAWLYSETGNNGKGTLCELWRNITGPNACASIPLADFGKDFLLEPLIRSSAVIVDENDVGTFLDRVANLKAVVTNDVISINRKHKTPISYQFFGFMVQCVNDMPKAKDRSDSFYRRQLVVPMKKNFKNIERPYIKNDYLHRTDVLKYVMKKTLCDIADYYQLSQPTASLEALEVYKETNDPIRGFFQEFRDQFAWDLLPWPFLYDLYRAWFVETNPSGQPVQKKVFIKDLSKIALESGEWFRNVDAKDYDRPTRSAKRMDNPELLIDEYNLQGWTRRGYKGDEPLKRVDFDRADQYRGLIRIASGPAGIVCDNDDVFEDQDVIANPTKPSKVSNSHKN